MAFANPLSFTDRIHSALNQPSLISKCQEISQLLQEVSSKDGIYILRLVIESLFGTSEDGSSSIHHQQLGGGWGLRIITLSEHRLEYQTLRNFLAPNGPLFNLIYRLSHDPYQLLPFPIAWLPAKTRSEILDGIASPFYLSKIQSLGPGKTPTSILFNTFEFYIFHFGYFLVGKGAQQWNLYWTSVKDALYPTLLEDYLAVFLPCDASLPPGPPTAPVTTRGVFSPISQRSGGFSGSLQAAAHNFSSFLSSPIAAGSSILHYGHETPPAAPDFHHQSSAMTGAQYPDVNTWTSQALVQVLMEVWINVCVPTPSLSTAYTSVNPAVSTSTMKEVFVPCGDHVRAVRMLVKHFHYFSNSVKAQYPSPLDPIRRNLWSLCRKSMYHFLNHLFVHWPLDSSFRLVLETWLSYIQPWRYTSYTSLERMSPSVGCAGAALDAFDLDVGGVMRCVDGAWRVFVAENLLFFCRGLELFLKRAVRIDLASPKNAQIVFRVAKVYSQDNLMSIIQEVEEALDSTHMQRSFVGLVGATGATSPTSPNVDGHFSPQALAQAVRVNAAELEKASYQHKSILGPEMNKTVCQLLIHCKRAQESLTAELAENDGAAHSSQLSWMAAFWRAAFESSRGREDDATLEEMRRSIAHLEVAVAQFTAIFNISSETCFLTGTTLPLPRTPEKGRGPQRTLTAEGLTLTDLGRHQLLNGYRRLDLKYEGDPDLKPICTFEVAFLVRMLYSMAKHINAKYGSQITTWYRRPDFSGSICRVLIRSPETVYEYRHSEDTHAKVAVHLPPRVTFRPIAHKKLLLSVFLLYVFLHLCGLSFGRVTVQLVTPFVLTYVVCKAALQHHFSGSTQQPGTEETYIAE